ncbi:MAG: single-stranded DNA-binding protein [Bacteroidales bacterium]|nr:single-stranded DNA-binding protein [Bacteroidales bacterium]
MEQINRIELLGIVGSVRTQQIGERRMSKFTMVTNRAYKNKEGAPVIESTWHNVTAFEGRQVQNLDRLEKGRPVHVWGRLQIQHYTGFDGTERTSVDVLCSRLEFIRREEEVVYEM